MHGTLDVAGRVSNRREAIDPQRMPVGFTPDATMHPRDVTPFAKRMERACAAICVAFHATYTCSRSRIFVKVVFDSVKEASSKTSVR